MMYLQPSMVSLGLPSVHLKVGRVPTRESIRLNEASPPPGRLVMIARAARSRLRWLMGAHSTLRQVSSQGWPLRSRHRREDRSRPEQKWVSNGEPSGQLFIGAVRDSWPCDRSWTHKGHGKNLKPLFRQVSVRDKSAPGASSMIMRRGLEVRHDN